MRKKQLIILSAVVCLLSFCTIPGEAEPIRHKVLLLDEARSQMLYIDQFDLEKTWCIKVDEGPAWGLQLLDGNRALTALPKKGGFREYDLTSRKIVREVCDAVRYAGAISALRLPDGRTVLACEQGHVRIFLLDTDGKEIAAWDFPDLKGIRQIRQTAANTLLFGSNTDWVHEISLQGEIVRKFQLPDAKYTYQISELPNGHLLVAAGYAGFLAEVDKQNNTVRRWGGRPEPEGLVYIFMSQFQILENGHLVVATWTGHHTDDSEKGQQLVEFDTEGNVVWTWHDSSLAGSVHSLIVMDEI
jgi:hypothetical protein